ncbi:MAG: response regulator transcription factor [Mariprofundaceae bacterium]|nr:response regulator transcription factor [Mariprofundaceae bacterium]
MPHHTKRFAMIKVVAADDHFIFLEGIKSLFWASKSIQMIDVCNDGDQLLALISEYNPDVALVDISMPGPGIESIVESVEALSVKTKIVALTMHLESDRAIRLLELGLSGYVVKDAAFEQLELAILSVADGDEYISPIILEAIREVGNTFDESTPMLTARELEVVQFLPEGFTNKMIARKLGISERTVRFHIANCCLKLNASRRSHVVAKAIQLNLV